MTNRVIALIPAFGEAASIADVVRRTQAVVDEVVVVDDGSADATGEVAAKAGATVLRHAQNQGKGAAILTALEHFRQTDARYALFLDADGQHDPAEIPAFIAAADANGAAVVIGTRMRDTREMPWLRRLTNRVMSWLISRLAHQPIPDTQCGFRLLARPVLPVLHLTSRHFETETEMLIQAGRAGLRIVSIPVRTIYLVGRTSRIRPGQDTMRFLKLVWRYGGRRG